MPFDCNSQSIWKEMKRKILCFCNFLKNLMHAIHQISQFWTDIRLLSYESQIAIALGKQSIIWIPSDIPLNIWSLIFLSVFLLLLSQNWIISLYLFCFALSYAVLWLYSSLVYKVHQFNGHRAGGRYLFGKCSHS